MTASILIMIHCDQYTGYAISSLEKVFYDAALSAGFAENQIFWSYRRLVTSNDNRFIEIDYSTVQNSDEVLSFIQKNNIKIALAFDMAFPNAIIPLLKRAGVLHIISYIGASMSGINSGLKLLLKKLNYLLRSNKPDLFIFESEAMRRTGTEGRGISYPKTRVIYLGVDTNRFYPCYGLFDYTYEQFLIPKNRKIAFYSGHMEERKGVKVIIEAAIHLVDIEEFKDIHFVICGNKNNEEKSYVAQLEGTEAKHHVTFAGYRNDIPELMRGSHIGIIASTGWDSFTMSSVEMMASGLPMIVSDLQGLSETILHDKNGYLFRPGDFEELSSRIKLIAEDSNLALAYSNESRIRAETLFDCKIQVKSIAKCINEFEVN